jgi:hypothetical protein
MKLYERYVKFVNNVLITLLDEQMTKIKVLNLDELYNFYIHDFSSWNHLLFKNIVWSCHFMKFKIWTFQTKSYKKMTKMKVINLDEFYNFYIYNIFILGHFLT